MKKLAFLFITIFSAGSAFTQCSISSNNIYAFTIQGKTTRLLNKSSIGLLLLPVQ